MKPPTFTTLTVNDRTALVHSTAVAPTWLLVGLHPTRSNGHQFAALTQFVPVLDAAGAAGVFPDAVNGEWNATDKDGGPDDIVYLPALITQIKINTPSIEHVVLVGYSNGAQMAAAVAVVHPDLVTVLATCSGGLTNPMINTFGMPTHALNVISFWGDADEFYTYDPPVFRFGPPWLGAPQNYTIWALTNGCIEDSGKQDTASPTVQLQTASDGTDDTQVQLYTLLGGGHTWPGSAQTALAGWLGATDLSISASQLIWEFCLASVAA